MGLKSLPNLLKSSRAKKLQEIAVLPSPKVDATAQASSALMDFEHAENQIVTAHKSRPMSETVQPKASTSRIVPDQMDASIYAELALSKRIYGFDLRAVLLKNEGVRKIVQINIPANRFVTKSDRQQIAAVLIDAVIINLGLCPSKKALEELARDLVLAYPAFGDIRKMENGWEMWFMTSPFLPSATGFLEERLKNQRKDIQAKQVKSVPIVDRSTFLNWNSENDDDDPDPEHDLLTFMQHNFGEEVKQTMKETVFSRRTHIRRIRQAQGVNVMENVMQTMPRLFDIEGMIVQDFNIRHPGLSLVFYNKWPRVSMLLIEYANQSGINYLKKLEILKSPSTFDNDDNMIIAYWMLPLVLPSCGRKVASSEENPPRVGSKRKSNSTSTAAPKKFKTVKASDKDSLESLIMFRSTNTHVADVLQENRNRAPFILALGIPALLKFDAFFVIIDKVAVPCGPRFLVALDTCFKSFYVLSLPFPLESYDHWTFLSHGVAGNGTMSPVPPVVQALIGQIMPKLE